MKVEVQIPPKLIPVFTGEARYRGSYGGRGSAKTRTFALMAAIRGYMYDQAGISGMILCGREYMNSLEDSSMEEIKQAIRETPWLVGHYDIGEKYIRTKSKRVNFGFAGLRHNLDSIKSKARILLAWVDEAEGVTDIAWQKLLPTVREENSEVWITWNPEDDESPTDKRFRKNIPDNAKIVEMNYTDNPWFPDVLEQERLNDLSRMDGATYSWIWEGEYRQNSDAQIFNNKYTVKEFDPLPEWDGPYCGLDFGFSQDPTAGIKCWVDGDDLMIGYDAGRVGLELDDTADYMAQRIPDFNGNVVRADSARPESISHLKRHGMERITGVKKGKGSVEDGIAHIRSYRQVVIHPRCKATIKEFQRYSYKVNKAGDVTTTIVDADNHYIDALRYALEPLMRHKANKPTAIFGTSR